MIGIIDYDLGNLGSIYNMLKKVTGENISFVNSRKDMLNCSHLILPGVGSFDLGIKNIRQLGMDEIINEYLLKEGKLLGICLGMQLLGNASEEGIEKGLGLIDFESIRFNFEAENLKVPHMGWNQIVVRDSENRILKGFDNTERYYFVHSYYAKCRYEENVLMETNYGIQFASAVSQNFVYGVQFHPEKSRQYGMKLFKNFIDEV